MYVRTFEGLAQVQRTNNCSSWERNPQSFSKAIAQHYVKTMLRKQLKAERVRCRPDGKVCEVTFPGDITVMVSLVKLPGHVIARQRGQGTLRREYNYYCTPEGRLRLHRRWHIVRIILIDPSGIFKNKEKLRDYFRLRLEIKFNNLDKNWLNRESFKFRVEYKSDDPTTEEKAKFGKLDFPVYLLGKQHGYKTIRKLMEQHKIPKTLKRQDIYDLAEKCWKQKDTRGCGIPSGDGYRKAGFIKTYKVFGDATGELWQAFVNTTAHEIGHMGNLLKHNKKGLMKYPVPLNQDIDFSLGDKGSFLYNLRRLKFLKAEK